MADSYSEFGQAANLSSGASPTVVIATVIAMGRALVRLLKALRDAGVSV